MAVVVLIIGRSGSGKSASMRNCVGNKNFNVINVINKPFPFRGKIDSGVTDDYNQVMKWLIQFPGSSIVIDDAGYLITNMFMNGHSNAGAGNAVFAFYNKLADHFWNLIEFIKEKVPANKIVYIIMHEDTDDFGKIKPKTIGKLLDEKVCIEGMFTIVLRCVAENGKHYFLTQTTENDVAKTPIDMFKDVKIDNDLLLVDQAIRDYYDLPVEVKKEDKK
jgi:ABC-type dipeptide/oligopeptide/nickel transport system ATPase component